MSGVMSVRFRERWPRSNVLHCPWTGFTSLLTCFVKPLKLRQHNLSLAVAWIAASTVLQEAVLVHKDPELRALDLDQEIFPLNGKISST